MALLGCIADDFTGATDLCNTLVKQGMPTVQLIDVPKTAETVDASAIVIALKSRSCPPAEAIEQSLAALAWLQNAGCEQFFFKYCSTFDSTDAGNIGPVADALLDALGATFTIACPAFPETGRTLYFGNLFVNGVPLAESPMRNHPLNPMTDSDLVRVLARQTQHQTGLVAQPVVQAGPTAIKSAFADLRKTYVRYAIVDAIHDDDLIAIGEACADLPLITGGSGIALGIPENFRQAGKLATTTDAATLPAINDPRAGVVISGSCSSATLVQISEMQKTRPSFSIKPLALVDHAAEIESEALAWAEQNLKSGPVLIYASAPPEDVAQVQESIGRERAGQLVEATLSKIARGLVERGVRRLVVAGGETSGAAVQALGIRALKIGPQIDPGVPWTLSLDSPRPVALALKSGNFGGPDFFLKALSCAP